MNTKRKIGTGLMAVGGAMIFFGLGDWCAVKRFNKRINTSQPLITNALVTIIEKAQEDWTNRDDLMEVINAELNFLNIVLKGGNTQ